MQNHDLKPLMECAVLTLKNLIEKDEAENQGNQNHLGF